MEGGVKREDHRGEKGKRTQGRSEKSKIAERATEKAKGCQSEGSQESLGGWGRVCKRTHKGGERLDPLGEMFGELESERRVSRKVALVWRDKGLRHKKIRTKARVTGVFDEVCCVCERKPLCAHLVESRYRKPPKASDVQLGEGFDVGHKASVEHGDRRFCLGAEMGHFVQIEKVFVGAVRTQASRKREGLPRCTVERPKPVARKDLDGPLGRRDGFRSLVVAQQYVWIAEVAARSGCSHVPLVL